MVRNIAAHGINLAAPGIVAQGTAFHRDASVPRKRSAPRARCFKRWRRGKWHKLLWRLLGFFLAPVDGFCQEGLHHISTNRLALLVIIACKLKRIGSVIDRIGFCCSGGQDLFESTCKVEPLVKWVLGNIGVVLVALGDGDVDVSRYLSFLASPSFEWVPHRMQVHDPRHVDRLNLDHQGVELAEEAARSR